MDVGGPLRMDRCGTGEGSWWVPTQRGLIVGLGECSERYRPIGIFTFRALWFGASNMVYSLHVPILRELNVSSYCVEVRVNWDVYIYVVWMYVATQSDRSRDV